MAETKLSFKNVYVHLSECKAQPAITWSKVTIKSLEQDVKYVRS